jgi:hypothetical protein
VGVQEPIFAFREADPISIFSEAQRGSVCGELP